MTKSITVNQYTIINKTYDTIWNVLVKKNAYRMIKIITVNILKANVIFGKFTVGQISIFEINDFWNHVQKTQNQNKVI